MEVRCERCGTEYEFDDALVSDRGTSVKCTECQHEFRVLPTAGAVQPGATADVWTVSRASGGQVVFTTLRDLQEAIRSGDLNRDDTVVRPGRTGDAGKPRALGAISELEHLFPPGLDPRLPPMRSKVDTLRPDPVASVPPPPEPAVEAPPVSIVTAPVASEANVASVKAPTTRTLVGLPPEDSPRVLHDLASDTSMSDLADDSVPLARPPRPLLERGARVSGSSGSMRAAQRSLRSSERIRAARIDSEAPIAEDRALPLADLEGLSGAAALDSSERLGSRRRVGGWVIGLVLVGGAAVVGMFVARPYLLGAHAHAATNSDAPLDPQAATLMTAADKALAGGDIDGAQESLDRASSLAPRDARVALDRAKVAAVRADIAWLRPRLFGSGVGADERATAERTRSELAQSADALATAAASLAPGDVASTRARVDVMRLEGKLPEARAAEAPLRASSSDPETAYVLAALDAADPAPLWGTVVDRLRVAAAAEGDLGRARALLVFALARAGDVANAGHELDKLATLPRAYPLLSQLRAFLEASKAQVPAGVAPTMPKEMDVNALPRTASAPVPPAIVPGMKAGAGGPGADNRALDLQGDVARSHGEYERAAKLYTQALDRNPNDSEALGGLGDVSHSKGDWEGAKASFRRALIVNPQYLPALVGLADVEYESGDKSAAEQTYREIQQRFPDGSYPKRVKDRAEGGSGGSATASGAALKSGDDESSAGSSAPGSGGAGSAAATTRATPAADAGASSPGASAGVNASGSSNLNAGGGSTGGGGGTAASKSGSGDASP